ncbi:MAG: tRNA lysidine(34) synthetase TilS, partial [Candidatus Eremiobacterota bacterium]
LPALRTECLVRPGDRVLVGVSGGPDSSALLLALVAARAELPLDLTAVYIDHGVRPPEETDADLRFVRSLAEQVGVPLLTERAFPASSSEEALRQARYAALLTAARRSGALIVALGHTMDDQAETVLMRLIRGAGLQGLGAMAPRAPWPFPASPPGPDIVRPLLSVRRAETEAYMQAHCLQPRRDPTNDDRRYLRNRIRQDLVPLLERENPRVVAAMANAASTIREAAQLIETEKERAWPEATEEREGALFLRAAMLAALPAAVVTAILAQALAWAGLGADAAALERLRSLLTGRAGRSATLPAGVRAVRLAHDVRIKASGGASASGPLPETRLAVPGETVVGPWIVRAAAWDGVANDDLAVIVPLNIAERGLWVRSRRPGDRLRPARGSRKVQDILVDAKVPRWERDRVPLIIDAEGQILAVSGLASSPFPSRTPAASVRIAFEPSVMRA